MVYRPPTYGISTTLPMVYRTPTFFPWYIDPLPMVYWPPYPCYIDPVPMVYQTLSYGIMNSSLMVLWIPLFWEKWGGFNLPWGGSKYNDKKLTPGSKYLMENWTRGQNIIDKSTPGSIYHGVQNTIWHRGQNIIGKSTPVSHGILNPMVNWTRGRFTYDILTPGSIFHMVFWPRGQFFVIVFWTPL
jgi:hypothetical protein